MRKSAILLVALVLALGLAVSCSRGRSDQQVATDIKAKMYSDPQLKTSSLDVFAKNGEVTLSGEVPSDAARYQAFKLASDTPGVNKVNDQMSVKTAELASAPQAQPEPAPAPAPARRVVRRPAAAPARLVEAPASPSPPAAQPVAAPAPSAPPGR